MSKEQTKIKCPKCKTSIPALTRICPECGNNIRLRAITNISIIAVGILVLLVMFFRGASERQSTDLAQCNESVECLGNINQQHFYNYCGFAIEKRAKFAFRWSNKEPDPQFSKFKWLDQASSKITTFGSNVQFQTATGAWQTINYECDLDLVEKRVIAVRVK